MKCPHELQPHQIQGMDCIKIFPVVQWLVKKAMERRDEMSQYIRWQLLIELPVHIHENKLF